MRCSQPGLRRLPIVVFTSSSQDPDVQRAYELGANSYLVKPISFGALVELMGTLGLARADTRLGSRRSAAVLGRCLAGMR